MSDTSGLVYVVDDDVSVREGVASLVRSVGLEAKVLASGQEFLAIQRPEIPSCLVLDVQMPGLSGLDLQQEIMRSGVNLPIIFLTGYGDIRMTVRAIQAGAADFLTKPFEKEELLRAIRRCFGRYQTFNLQARDQSNGKLAQEKLYLEDKTRSEMNFGEIIGNSASLRGLLKQVETVAPTNSTVLIYGETGTGKELIARSIHKNSQRNGRAFVSVNCAALPPSLILSELFGHEKGAFTGAMQRRLGRFELADGGTIFLDEVGELLPDTQIALLRVLQEREFERVGGGRPVRVDVRVIAATNRDLKTAVANGTFRQDLFYRLNVFPVDVPPLRERKDDIPLLVWHFTQQFAKRLSKVIDTISSATMDALRRYYWPGNIRELQNVIERSVILCETEIFSIDESWLPQQQFLTEPRNEIELSRSLQAEEMDMIEAALKESGGRVFGPSGAAAKLGIARSTLESKIRSLKIDKNRFRVSRVFPSRAVVAFNDDRVLATPPNPENVSNG
jgi:DNA-binding NtrC family response regulator